MILVRRFAWTLIASLAALLLVGCPKPKPADAPLDKSGPDHSVVLGKWVVVADASGRGDKGNLELLPDGTFKADYTVPGGKTESYKGSYRVADRETMGGKAISVVLTIKEADGKPAPASPGLELNYNEDDRILHDLMTIAYARPDEAEKGAKLFERPAGPSNAVKAPELPNSEAWRVDIPGGGLRFGVVAANVSGNADDEIVTTDSTGFRVYDSAGKLLSHAKVEKGAGGHFAVGSRKGKPVVVLFGTWSSEATAYDLGGTFLWQFQTPSGIDWLCPVRLDAANTGYGIAYNGGGGVELLDANGASKWLASADWNAWGVTAWSRDGTLPESVVAVGDDDDAVVFDPSGKSVVSLATGEIGSLGTGDIDGDGKSELLALGTTVSSGLKLTVLSQTGNVVWSQPASATDAAFVDGTPFLAGRFGKRGRLVGVADGGGVLFFDAGGKVVGKIRIAGGLSGACVVRRSGKTDLLVVRTEAGLSGIDVSTVP